MTNKKKSTIGLSRRRVLAGLGVVGFASVGAGVGTTAYFSDQVTLDGNTIQAGEFGLTVEQAIHAVDQDGIGPDEVTFGENASDDGLWATDTITIEDAKPGDSYEFCWDITVHDNPGYVSLAACYTDLNGAEAGNVTPDDLWEIGDETQLSTIGDETLVDSVTLEDGGTVTYDYETVADLLADLSGGTPLDGAENGVVFEPGETWTLCIELSIPTTVGNELQGASLEWDMLFYAEQARHNDVAGVADRAGALLDCDSVDEAECVECSFDTGVASSPEVAVDSTNTAAFPDIGTFLTIDTPAGNAGTLGASDFALCEDGCEQEVAVEITGENKPVEFVFQLDVTGSMGGEIAGVKAEIENFVDAVDSEGIDARYALYLFGDDDDGEVPPGVFLKQDLTADKDEIIDAVQDTSLAEAVGFGGDGPEDNYEVIITPTCELSFRPGAEIVMIDVTDAPSEEDLGQTVCGMPETKASAIDVLTGNVSGFPKPTYFAVSPPREGTHEKKTIADEVDGTWIELGENFEPILTAIEEEVASSYRVSYTTTNPASDGSVRNVVVRIDDPDEGTLYATTSYAAPSP
jgi:predicted ribosomally synthesized peptide with SipW-like signal peptide